MTLLLLVDVEDAVDWLLNSIEGEETFLLGCCGQEAVEAMERGCCGRPERSRAADGGEGTVGDVVELEGTTRTEYMWK